MAVLYRALLCRAVSCSSSLCESSKQSSLLITVNNKKKKKRFSRKENEFSLSIRSTATQRKEKRERKKKHGNKYILLQERQNQYSVVDVEKCIDIFGTRFSRLIAENSIHLNLKNVFNSIELRQLIHKLSWLTAYGKE